MGNRQELSVFKQECTHINQLARQVLHSLRRIWLRLEGDGAAGCTLVTPPPAPGDGRIEGALRCLTPAAAQEEDALRAFADAAGRLRARFAALPLLLEDGGIAGTVCFERDEGEWTAEEQETLHKLMPLYACAVRSEKLGQDFSLQAWVFNQVVDSMYAYIYVTDVDTDEILYMNRAMKEGLGLDAPEGAVCWKVLQTGMHGRCAFCPVPLLQDKNGPAPSCIWEEHNTRTGRIYENYDSLMRWVDGRTVHFQHSVDVTETRRLYREATTDDLTGAFSRRAGKQKLAALLAGCGGVSICMLDINDLKQVNDTLGHAAGDRLLVQAAQAVQAQLTGGDFLMRLGGDEFVAVLPGVAEDEAQRRICAALRQLQEAEGAQPQAGFCYGIAQFDGAVPLGEALALVDERMYTQKRALHIRRAAERLQREGTHSAPAFSYDCTRLYDALVQSTDDYIYVCDMKTGVFRYPPAMVAEFGLPGEVVENAAAVWGAKVHPLDKQAFLESNQEITDGRTDAHCVEYRAQNRRGEWVWMRCRGHLERDGDGQPTLFAGIITNLGKKNRIDQLTGLFNKFEFQNAIDELSTGAAGPYMVIQLGIDNLRRINALYDRRFGDEVIRIAAQKLQSLLPPDAWAYRLDGDEFGVLLRNGSKDAAGQLFARIRQAFAHQQSYDGKRFFCTLSGGCALYPQDGRSYLELSKSAGYALEYAKQRGKNRMEYYAPQIVAHRERSLELTELLRDSVEHGFRGFEMYYQPVFSGTRALEGAEALARWRCDKYGAVGPAEFIPLLEQSGLIQPVGRWAFAQAVTAQARWGRRLPRFKMGVNLSYLQLEDDEFFPFMWETIQKAGADPKQTILELTESYLAANMERVADRLRQVRRHGVRVAMDDFGTGYSSLGVLKQAPIDIAKIDRTFVNGIQESAFDNAFLRMVVELCRVRGISTCLEGMETEGQWRAAEPMHLDYVQGFLLGRPVPAGQFETQFL
ncbi:EAL domain-containing protein [Intestinibacillus massiliensis]|nr:EAL domain-containing protein [Intestinibacillus massiliensis]